LNCQLEVSAEIFPEVVLVILLAIVLMLAIVIIIAPVRNAEIREPSCEYNSNAIAKERKLDHNCLAYSS
jgi:hypothetical protein